MSKMHSVTYKIVSLLTLNCSLYYASVLLPKDFILQKDKTFDDTSPLRQEAKTEHPDCIALCQLTNGCKSYSYSEAEGSCILHDLDGESHPELLIEREGYVLADGNVPQKQQASCLSVRYYQ